MSSFRLSLGSLVLAVLAGCAAPTSDDVDVASPEVRSTPSELVTLVEPHGHVFNVFCADSVTGTFGFRVRGFFQPKLYPHGSLDRTEDQEGFPDNPQFPSIDIVPTDSPHFLAVVGSSTELQHTDIVFARGATGITGTGQLRGIAGTWTCTLFAREDGNGVRPWTRVL